MTWQCSISHGQWTHGRYFDVSVAATHRLFKSPDFLHNRVTLSVTRVLCPESVSLLEPILTAPRVFIFVLLLLKYTVLYVENGHGTDPVSCPLKSCSLPLHW